MDEFLNHVPSNPPGHRCGFVSLAGQPNVGKSTLLNTLVGQHLSIVSAKAQTTRERVAGILSGDGFQILFIDAPGLIQPRYALQEAMALAANAAIEEADLLVLITDATRPGTLPNQETIGRIAARRVPVIAALNKADSADRQSCDRQIAELRRAGFDTIAISALKGDGCDELVGMIVPLLPESPPLYPQNDSATQSVRFFVAELVRESCMDFFGEEIPYSIICRVDEFCEDRDPIFIRVVIYVERESQKGMVIGKGGAAIKRIGETSRKKIEELVEGHVYLELRVKVMKGWPRKHARLHQLGFALPPKARGGHSRP
jgi:GTP-binding protein Era